MSATKRAIVAISIGALTAAVGIVWAVFSLGVPLDESPFWGAGMGLLTAWIEWGHR
jgi:hypothetical protein